MTYEQYVDMVARENERNAATTPHVRFLPRVPLNRALWHALQEIETAREAAPAPWWPCELCGGAVAATLPPICTACGAVQTIPPAVAAAASYCGDCDETYTAGAVAKRCSAHEAARAARIAAWRAAGGSGGHYDDTDTDTEGTETR